MTVPAGQVTLSAPLMRVVAHIDNDHGHSGAARPFATIEAVTPGTGEAKIRHRPELHLGQKVRVRSWLLDHDAKRFHTWQELHAEDGFLAATAETLALHIDMSGPKVAPLPRRIAAGLDAFAAKHGLPELPKGADGRRRRPLRTGAVRAAMERAVTSRNPAT